MNAAPWLGIIALVGIVLLVGGALVALHFIARPHGGHDVRETESLSALFIRGGRQRFSIRLFESGLLAAIWTVGGAILLLFATVRAPDGPVLFAIVGIVGPLVVGTWWAWRRGVLLSMSRSEDVNLLALERRRRRHD